MKTELGNKYLLKWSLQITEKHTRLNRDLPCLLHQYKITTKLQLQKQRTLRKIISCILLPVAVVVLRLHFGCTYECAYEF